MKIWEGHRRKGESRKKDGKGERKQGEGGREGVKGKKRRERRVFKAIGMGVKLSNKGLEGCMVWYGVA